MQRIQGKIENISESYQFKDLAKQHKDRAKYFKNNFGKHQGCQPIADEFKVEGPRKFILMKNKVILETGTEHHRVRIWGKGLLDNKY